MPTTAPPRPLDGIRILDAATFIAGPFTTAVLGEFGAEVIKVEQPGAGDPFRRFGTPTARGDSLAFLSEARDKRSVTLDLRQPAGARIFRKLAAKSQVVCENFRPGTMERWGLGWSDLRAVNPALVMLRVSGYGQDGPYAGRPGFARIAHAFGGLTHLAGMPDGPPVTPGSTSLADYMSGLFGAVGVLMALRHAEQTGEGQVIDIALYESVFRVLDEMAPRYAHDGTVRGREGAGTLNACPHGHFPCADGAWVAIACTSDKMFARLTEVMDRADLLARFPTTADRLADRATVDGAVETWTGTMPRDEVVQVCTDGHVPCGPVNTIADLFADPHIAARGNMTQVLAEGLGPVTLPNVLPRLSATPGHIDRAGPPLGADTDAVLSDLLGIPEAERATLRADGVI
ncbi:CaiB/BaiF CoA transferase family protein [Rhodospira trueperi]|uniref:Succinyl-CoA:(S)-malate CoA-transferase subunit A/succinyl-CoA:(S)-malate CoA-transferase subunit B n=1 Tax=Rhodospira trueperi TaxID=69960 RepID=A0A1G6YXN6_9PROT|nr:CaiB/BaiF CoA-transferase family protein [Rhodospira trueperi]SDD94405.1 succinyl-CoA:(S)-malate CoA-transferase subunit A/succinyl-CoA:(S)-malate CoA-transferase subunit B [Rhodospira trueperi]